MISRPPGGRSEELGSGGHSRGFQRRCAVDGHVPAGQPGTILVTERTVDVAAGEMETNGGTGSLVS